MKRIWPLLLLVPLGSCATAGARLSPSGAGDELAVHLHDLSVDNRLTEVGRVTATLRLSYDGELPKWQKTSGQLETPRYFRKTSPKKNLYGIESIQYSYSASFPFLGDKFNTFEQVVIKLDGRSCVTGKALERAFHTKHLESMQPPRVEPWGAAPGYKLSAIVVQGGGGSSVDVNLDPNRPLTECLTTLNISATLNRPFDDAAPAD